MPTATESALAQEAPVRSLLGAKVSAISIVLASIATLVVVVGMLRSADDEPVQTQSVPAQPNSVSQRVAAPAKPTSVAPQPKPAALATDEHGFVDSAARCNVGQQAVAIARTLRSAIVICRESDGTYEYAATRLHDGASLRLDDVLAIPAGFEARNDGTTYRLSAKELIVITGEDLLSRDAIVEYRVS